MKPLLTLFLALVLAGCAAKVQPPTAAPTTAQNAIVTAAGLEQSVALEYEAGKKAIPILVSDGAITAAQGAKVAAWLDSVARANDAAIAATRAALAVNSSASVAVAMQAVAKAIGSASASTFGITNPQSVGVYDATVATLVGFAGAIEQQFGNAP